MRLVQRIHAMQNAWVDGPGLPVDRGVTFLP